MEIRLPQPNRIVLQGLTQRSRASAAPAVDAVSMIVRAGEFVVLLGARGSGKTTLLRAIAGLDTPAAGSVHIDGVEATELAPSRRNLAFVFQKPALYPHLRVEENVALPLRRQRVAANALVRRVDELIDSFELEHLRRLKPSRLTQEERHLAGLARAMVRDPLAFLMDEPLGTLQGAQRQRIRDRIKAIHQNLRATTIYATNNADDAYVLADRIAVIREGRLVQYDTPAAIRASPAQATLRPVENPLQSPANIAGQHPH
jgi:multiple sugar transport system ATP-binding protein